MYCGSSSTKVKTSTEAIATAALEVANIAECNCIATFSQSGRSVLRVARMRPDVTLIGLTTIKNRYGFNSARDQNIVKSL